MTGSPTQGQLRKVNFGTPPVEHYVNGRQVYTLAEASDLLHVAIPTLRQRVHRKGIEAAGWIGTREPVYYPEDLGLPAVSEPTSERQAAAEAALAAAWPHLAADPVHVEQLAATALNAAYNPAWRAA